MATITEKDMGQATGYLPKDTPPILSQQEWEAARQKLLVKEKALTRSRDAIAALESATRGLRRMEAVPERVPEHQVSALLAKLQAPPLHEIADMPTLALVVQGLESIVNGSHPSAA